MLERAANHPGRHRLRVAGAVGFALALLLVCGAGCRQILGIDDREVGPEAFPGKCGGFNYPSAACAACMDAACCDELGACIPSPSCDAHLSCALACKPDDVDCQTACTWQRQRWVPLHAAVLACRAANCAEACGVTCGGIEYFSSECATCAGTSCCAKATACGGSAECLAARGCSCTPGDGACSMSCQASNPDGYAVASDLATCIDGSCNDVCAPGTSWGCLGKPGSTLKPKSSSDVTLSYQFLDFIDYKPWEGITVDACQSLDATCAGPVDTETSGAPGNPGLLQFKLPVGTEGFSGYLRLEGGAVYPGYAYVWQAPIVENAAGTLRWPTADEMNAMASIVKVSLDPSLGHLGVNTLDCEFNLAAGVSLSVDPPPGPSATPFYFSPEGLPAKAPDNLDATTAPYAIGGWVNLPVGADGSPIEYKVTATRLSTGETIGSRSVLVRPGALTFAFLSPRG